MGFKVSWKLIALGLFGSDKIPIQLTYTDLFDYLDRRLSDDDEWVNESISLICEKGNESAVRKLIQKFADNDCCDIEIQERKWRAFILRNVLDGLNTDCLQGLLQLMDFWISMGMSKKCPQAFPGTNEGLSVQDYFTESTYNQQIDNNKKWLEQERAFIMAEESKLCI